MKKLVLLSILAFSCQSMAAIVSVPSQKISNLRIEGVAGFIGLNNAFESSSNCGGRVWINLNEEIGRLKYSTAMMAFASGKVVSIRADNEAARVFNECQLYDIVVHE
ncbi:exported hypothetical protein [Vibrio nigripulchritudo SO65]|uniref:hypothetical protein n=1 Tax=Vibrio nigripulchritudo TaxID=28173 RepID=UPI0003B24106|nr:hypothetical protein [Vibrio nigripulchritudo]CCN34330.1 exported hypothetical protein [Vibrio nigripulchritudo AM115]CCN43935.1 exported hypothetical protein [Vibrio nigripulchritudo FTn2]CCN62791.1 exported hypothetical protein [Vibrio nigripulchritudo POn4]CCN79575.1 exported hypothetical protein [Vibrio nigripulchritudo SO65]